MYVRKQPITRRQSTQDAERSETPYLVLPFSHLESYLALLCFLLLPVPKERLGTGGLGGRRQRRRRRDKDITRIETGCLNASCTWQTNHEREVLLRPVW